MCGNLHVVPSHEKCCETFEEKTNGFGIGRSELPGILTHFCKLIAPYQLDYSSQIVIPYYLYHFNKYRTVDYFYISSGLKLELRSSVKTS